MDANSWANNRSGAAKPERRQDIYGGTLGGPARQEQAVFLRGLSGTRYNAPGFETLSVVPEAWRRGDLSSVSSVIRDPLTQQTFAGNQIPLGRISPIARAILSNASLYPLPNRTVSGGVIGNFVGRNADDHPCAPGRCANRLERVEPGQDLRTLFGRLVPLEKRQTGLSAAARQPDRRARSAIWH
jgi:hypothetical protein